MAPSDNLWSITDEGQGDVASNGVDEASWLRKGGAEIDGWVAMVLVVRKWLPLMFRGQRRMMGVGHGDQGTLLFFFFFTVEKLVWLYNFVSVESKGRDLLCFRGRFLLLWWSLTVDYGKVSSLRMKLVLFVTWRGLWRERVMGMFSRHVSESVLREILLNVGFINLHWDLPSIFPCLMDKNCASHAAQSELTSFYKLFQDVQQHKVKPERDTRMYIAKYTFQKSGRPV
jgi:hypothetical protein